MLQAEVITDLGQLKNLKPEWNKLLEHSHTNSIFLTWEWIYSWWVVFGTASELFVVTVKNEFGKLVGIAPLYIRKSIYYRFPVREMAFIGKVHSDRVDFIVIDGNSTIVVEEILSTFFKFNHKWDIVNLEQIPIGSALLKEKQVKWLQCESEFCSLCPYINITTSWDDFFKSFSKKFRKDIRNKTNKINKLGKFQFHTNSQIEDFNELFNSIKIIEAKSRKHKTKKAFFANPDNETLLRRFCESSVKNGWFDFSYLTLNDTLIAYLIGFTYNNKYYAYNIAYSNDFFDLSPGKLLINEKIKWCFNNQENIEEFDFLRGDFYIKSLWTSEARDHCRLVFFNHSLYSRFLRYLAFRIRPKIKRLVKNSKL